MVKATVTERELRTVEKMIRLYCRHKEGNRELCAGCKSLLEYAAARLSACPFKGNKPTCRLCTVHCYRTKEKLLIKEIMRYAGPRMIFYHPADALRHLISEAMARAKGKNIPHKKGEKEHACKRHAK